MPGPVISPRIMRQEFDQDMTLFEWITQWQPPGADEQLLRGTLGRMLFSRDDSEKSVKVVSGGEEGRLLFGKLILQKPNVMVMDEPTNHLDMESIEALNLALEKLSRHADLHQPRPGVRIIPGYTHY